MSEYTAGQVERAAGSMRVRSSDELEVERMLLAYAATLRQQAERCPYCDNTGDVHSIDGEWRGECHECKARQAERAGVVVSDEACVMLRRKLPLGCAGLVGNDEARFALEAVAPLLRAPAEQGGRVDGFEDWWERTESDVSSPHDAAKSAWQAASAQNAQGEAVAVVGRAGPSRGALFWLPEGQKADLPDGTKLYTHADLQNAQREAVAEVTDGAGKFAYLGGSPVLPAGTKLCLHAERVMVPEGWVLVPREPTEEMIEAAFSSDSPGDDPSATPDYAAAYKAMLAAAPSQPEDAA